MEHRNIQAEETKVMIFVGVATVLCLPLMIATLYTLLTGDYNPSMWRGLWLDIEEDSTVIDAIFDVRELVAHIVEALRS